MKAIVRVVVFFTAALALLGLSACGSDEQSVVETSSAAAADAETASTDEAAAADDDHGDDDHGDEDHDDDHGDEDHDEDHGDEDHDDDHGDEDHDEDHGDDDHGDEDHGDEDHDDEDHDDEDHDDEDHDDEDHDDEDHDDEDHDDEHDHDGETSGLGAHEHGAAELTVAWSDGDMVIDLISPTFNIFGFEYEAASDEDLATAADRTAALNSATMVAVNEQAGCSLVDDVSTELEYDGSHAEITASWMLRCENPDNIEQLDAAELFAAFPNLQDLDVQWASDSQQSSAELSPSATVLRLS